MQETCFTLFETSIDQVEIPNQLNNPFDLSTPEICKIAAAELQTFLLENEQNWKHNFGTSKNKSGLIKGKMFGVLVVRNSKNELGYLCAISGKLADEIHHSRFVPSIFDDSVDDYFINRGMSELTAINKQISNLDLTNQEEIDLANQLKKLRKIKSSALQQKLFDSYVLLNSHNETRTITTVFAKYGQTKPPTASGECAAPKLFHYAFRLGFKPIAIAEFWWGESPKSENRIHKEFYPACIEKCKPILKFMLGE